jgi:hypothetical protein
MSNEEGLLRYIAAGGKLDAPENASPRYRGELMRLMAVPVPIATRPSIPGKSVCSAASISVRSGRTATCDSTSFTIRS